jgi:hypothetical protein
MDINEARLAIAAANPGITSAEVNRRAKAALGSVQILEIEENLKPAYRAKLAEGGNASQDTSGTVPKTVQEAEEALRKAATGFHW